MTVVDARLDHLAIAARFAAAPEQWPVAPRFNPVDRWYHRLHVADDYEVWLLTWLPGQGTEWHDHGGSAGAFHVFGGTLTEDTVALGDSGHRTGHQALQAGAGLYGVAAGAAQRDAGQRDAAAGAAQRDAGQRDAGQRDAGQRDAAAGAGQRGAGRRDTGLYGADAGAGRWEPVGGAGRSPRVTSRELGEGAGRRFGSHHIHRMTNRSNRPAVSVHVYGPALTTMTKYRISAAGLEVLEVERAGAQW
ncbi:cysteine dioxygenase [Actinoplanes sp. URMC 104]|uniref:cysteine dioxygenase n=1 Tax=Actinoplanes sp. URMC 104 TaxID=3423409 RepID=UPI003F1C392B